MFKRLRNVILVLSAIFLLLSSGVVFLIYNRYAELDRKLPTASDLKVWLAHPQLILRRDAAGNIHRECLCPLPLPDVDMPRAAKFAAVAIEDSRFGERSGVLDWKGIARAVYHAFLHPMRRPEGASTIPQQLAKLVILSDASLLDRKIGEYIVASRILTVLSKSEVVTAYLNFAYYGHGVVGVEKAARYYFRKNAASLNDLEMAMLVGSVNNPARLNPKDFPGRSLARAHQVLDGEVRLSGSRWHVSAFGDARRRYALSRRLGGGSKDMPDLEIGYYLDWVARGLIPHLTGAGPWRAPLTIDLDRQAAGISAISVALAEGEAREVGAASLVAMNQHGEVLAMYGGEDFAESQFNVATMANRPAASAAKIVTYAAACEAGYEVGHLVSDQPDDNGFPHNEGGWSAAPVRIDLAFAKSKNAATLNLAREIGFPKVHALARVLGMPEASDADLVLGNVPMNATRLAAIYSMLINDGYLVNSEGAFAILDRGGGVTERLQGRPRRRILSARCVGFMHYLMARVVSIGTARHAHLPKHVIGKTGTAKHETDAWFVGLTSDEAVVVWLGGDKDVSSPMRNVEGGGLPAKTAGRYLFRVRRGLTFVK